MKEMNIPVLDVPRVVILGGGFAGLRMAHVLDTRYVQVVLIDQNNYHTFQPLLYQVASAGLEPDSITYPLRKILKNKPRTHIRMAQIEEIDQSEQRVYTSIGWIHYDFLVIATGANTNYFGNKRIEQFAMPMKNLTEALDLRSLILQNFEAALNENDMEERDRLMNFVIAGGGPTGVELAGALSELKKHVLPKDYPDLDIRRMQIHLVEAAPELLGAMSDEASANSHKYLKEMGVNIWTDTFVEDYDGKTILTNNRNFHSRVLIWSAGVTGNIPSGIREDQVERGRIKIDKYCMVQGSDRVVAIGDVALLRTQEFPDGLPMLASVAQQQGQYLGKALINRIREKPVQAFSYVDKGTMATVGRNKAVVDLGRLRFGGIFAWMTWLFVHLMLLVDFRSRIIVFINWVWSYVKFDRGTRLIIRPFVPKPLRKKQRDPEPELL